MLGYNVKLENDLCFVDKPEGISTHASDTHRPGICEKLTTILNRKLWVVHRLDKTTSGALVFAESAERAEDLRKLFATRQVEKTYWFITDRRSQSAELERSSFIRKQGKEMLSTTEDSPNATTSFKRLKRSPFFELWEARPQSGKPHQIRLHASDLGLPILGDTLYGGSPFSRVCLHAYEITIPGFSTWICAAPPYFERMGLLRDREICKLIDCIDARARRFNFLAHRDQCLRLIDNEVAGLTLDHLGPILWLNSYRVIDTPLLERVGRVARLLGQDALVQEREDRGSASRPNRKIEVGAIPDVWRAQEGRLIYEFRKTTGESSGLFLDQRLNRQKLLTGEFRDARVLNLFAYTGGFSLAALAGGAKAVTQVDQSAVVNQWAAENLKHNQTAGVLPLESSIEFFAADTLFFLTRAQAKGRKWDLIVCDPPIFSRNKGKEFRIERDYASLLKLCASCLSGHGTLFFSTHFEKWSMTDVEDRLKRLFTKAVIVRGEVGDEFPQTTLKSFWINF